jgi:hypothetical protein
VKITFGPIRILPSGQKWCRCPHRHVAPWILALFLCASAWAIPTTQPATALVLREQLDPPNYLPLIPEPLAHQRVPTTAPAVKVRAILPPAPIRVAPHAFKGGAIREPVRRVADLPPIILASARPARPVLPQIDRYAVPTTPAPLYIPGASRRAAINPNSTPAPAIATPPLASEKGESQFPIMPPIERVNPLDTELSAPPEIHDPIDLLPTPVLPEPDAPTTRPITPPKPPMQ